MIRVACPHCKRSYRTQTEGMGKTAVCTKCHQSFRIGEVRLPFEWKPSDLGEDSWIGVEAPREKKELKQCIICDAPLDEGQVRCRECGANQVTGLAHGTPRQASQPEASVWSAIPTKPIVIAVLALLVVGGVYWAARSIGRSIATSGEQAFYMGVARKAERHLAENGPDDFDTEFSGQVMDSNLAGFVSMLSAGKPSIRRAVTLLIGCGSITQLRPILDRADDENVDIDAVLEAIGGRRLIALSIHEDPQIRHAAAEALCRLSELECGDDTVRQLAEATSRAEKIQRLNNLCRPWPEAVGTYVAVLGETVSPVLVIEQIGLYFHLLAGQAEFLSPKRQRVFDIPIHQWCAATGSAVDAKAVRDMMTGSVTLISPAGASWQGTLILTPKRLLSAPLPGFCPVQPPPPGKTAEVAFDLERIEGELLAVSY